MLLVEGQDDKHVVLHLRKQYQATLSFFFLDPDKDDSQVTVSDRQAVSIRDAGNINKVLESIIPEIKAPGRQAVGILVDANDDVTGRWEAIRNRLQGADINPPQHLSPDGTIIQANPRIGIWLMPDNMSVGELEDFVVKMIPEGDQVWPLSQRYIEEIPEEERKFSDGKTLRAQLYAWLAAREDPRLMGLAIRAQDLKVDGTLSQKFVAWLNTLFG
jgi:hypothetical protein